MSRFSGLNKIRRPKKKPTSAAEAKSRKQKRGWLSLLCVNQSKVRMPRAFLTQWVAACASEFKKRGLDPQQSAILELVVVFMDTAAAKKINLEFRNKNYATDVLSFESPGALGELVLCPQVIQMQALEHEVTFREELGYMVLHGMLHLLGFEHEENKDQANAMYALQDAIFERLR